MNFDPARALEPLKIGAGSVVAVFRDGQEEVIRHVVEDIVDLRGSPCLAQRLSPLAGPRAQRA
jgi:hypothetical protein